MLVVARAGIIVAILTMAFAACTSGQPLTGIPDLDDAATDVGEAGTSLADAAGKDTSVVMCSNAQDCMVLGWHDGVWGGPSSIYCCTDNVCVPALPDPCTDANVQLIRASDYDQSCKTDSDCFPVAEGNACYTRTLNCPNAAINRGAFAQYQSDTARTRAASCDDYSSCLAGSGPCCRTGTCQWGAMCFAAGDAGADAGDASAE